MALDLIGRDHPAGVLRAELSRAAESHGGLVLVTGEAGIGKTTLVTAAMEAARRDGALVLSGSCWDSSAAPGFWPWVQVTRGLRRQASAQEWAAAQEAAGGQLSFLLGDAPSGGPSDGFQLYDALTSALVAASQHRPVVVVLDDLHWADASSVRMLEFVAQHTWFERLLLIGTYRDVEVEAADHPLAPLMLPLLAKATTVTLMGLGRDEVAALMTRTVGDAPDPRLVAEVHLRTGGNPFFVEQTARLWHSGGEVTAVAPGVRAAVRRRLSLLPGSVSLLLTGAAVLGREFHRQLLAATVAAPVAQVDRLLAQAVGARLVTALGDGRFAFAHDLVRETLYDELDETELGDRHAAVVRALDRSPALAERILPVDLARHAYLGRTTLDGDRVVELLDAAARDARRRLAFEESVGHYRRAVELLDGADLRRVRLQADLGLQLHHFGQTEEAWTLFTSAAELALAADDPDPLARLALSLYGLSGTGTRVRLRDDLMRAAHRRLLGDTDPAGGRSVDHLAQEVIRQVIDRARSGDDDEALGFSLWTKHDTLWGLGNARKRQALTDELAAVSRRIGDAEMEEYAVSLDWVAALEQGDPSYHDRYLRFLALAEANARSGLVVGTCIDRAIVEGFLGRFDEAERQLRRVTDLQVDKAYFAYMSQHLSWALLLLRNRYEGLEELIRAAAAAAHPYPALLTGVTAAERGDAEGAVRCLEELETAREPVSATYLPLLLRLRAQVAALTRDRERCDEVRAVLAPHAGTWLVSMYGCDVSGPVSLWLATLDAACERWQEAVDGFTAALRSADLLGSRPWSAKAKEGLAQALGGRGGPDDLARAAALRAELGPAPTIGPPNEFHYTGETWRLSMHGRTVHVPDSKGLRDLHVLLRTPGTEVPATRLLNPAGGREVVAAATLGGDDVLDEAARASYRRRLSQLDTQIGEATARGDDTRAAAYDRERQALLTELRAAAGLGNRTRRLGDETERARKTVTARIRDTLRKLDTSHPELASHLRSTITTGTMCGYAPPTQLNWQL